MHTLNPGRRRIVRSYPPVLVVLCLPVIASLAMGTLQAQPATGDDNRPQAEMAAPGPLADLFGGPFELTDHNGRVRTERDFAGRFMLLYFGYTYCPDICPTGLSTLSKALRQLPPEDRARIQPLFITVDPERDTPAVLKRYLSHFHPDLLGLSGTPGQTDRVARAYRIHRERVLPRYAKNESEYLISHGSMTFLMGPDGKFLTLFPHGRSAPEMARTLLSYL